MEAAPLNTHNYYSDSLRKRGWGGTGAGLGGGGGERYVAVFSL